jgi:uncharacterized protein YbbK (DUF523 family)
MALENIKIGISSCLLGNKVRYDGGDERDIFIIEKMGSSVKFVPVCPEVELGLGVPREPIRLWFNPDSPRLIAVNSGKDLTNRMIRWAKRRVKELEEEDLWGFIFKSGSPSDGIRNVKVYMGDSKILRKGVGIFARVFMEHFPFVPVEDEKRLKDPIIWKNFEVRILVMGRWRNLISGKKGIKEIFEFHEINKPLILSYSPKNLQAMNNLLAKRKEIPLREIYSRYQGFLIDALKPRSFHRKDRTYGK